MITIFQRRNLQRKIIRKKNKNFSLYFHQESLKLLAVIVFEIS